MNRNAVTRQASTIAPGRAARLAITVVGVQLAVVVGLAAGMATAGSTPAAERSAVILGR